MKIPQLKQFCCGCTLETGAIIIGWLDLVFSIFMLLSSVYGMVGGRSNSGESHGTITWIFIILSAVIHAVIAIMLLIGVRRRIQKYLHIWVMISTIGVIVNCLFIVIESIMLIANGSAMGGLSSLVGGLLAIVIQCYFICVVHSLSREMISEQQQV